MHRPFKGSNEGGVFCLAHWAKFSLLVYLSLLVPDVWLHAVDGHSPPWILWVLFRVYGCFLVPWIYGKVNFYVAPVVLFDRLQTLVSPKTWGIHWRFHAQSGRWKERCGDVWPVGNVYFIFVDWWIVCEKCAGWRWLDIILVMMFWRFWRWIGVYLMLLHSCSHGVIYWEMFKPLPLTGWFAKLTAGWWNRCFFCAFFPIVWCKEFVIRSASSHGLTCYVSFEFSSKLSIKSL